MDKKHEKSYVLDNSYRLKIKKPEPNKPRLFYDKFRLLGCYSAFMETRNSSFDSVLASRLIRNSMASIEVISER
jgi:hypothetical protein